MPMCRVMSPMPSSLRMPNNMSQLEITPRFAEIGVLGRVQLTPECQHDCGDCDPLFASMFSRVIRSNLADTGTTVCNGERDLTESELDLLDVMQVPSALRVCDIVIGSTAETV
jgi:hypothetical protein